MRVKLNALYPLLHLAIKMEAVSSFTMPLISKPTRHYIYEDCSIQYNDYATRWTNKGFKFNS